MHTLSKGEHALEYRQVKIFDRSYTTQGACRLVIVIRIAAVTFGQILSSCNGECVEHFEKTFAFSPQIWSLWAICPFPIIKYIHT